MKTMFQSRLMPVSVALTLLTGAVAGCGGGSSSVARPAAVTLNGTLLDSSSTPLSGYTVVYTPGGIQPAARVSPHATAVLTTVTDSLGHYTLVIPAAQVTGHDSLAFYDVTGVFTQMQSLTLSTTQTGTVTVPQSVTTTLPAPPDPPASAL